jgi:hypothetical protein
MSGLQTIDFFIPLPEPVDVQDGINFPLVEIDDGGVIEAIRFKDEDGVSKRFSRRIMFCQVPSSLNEPGMNEAFAVFKTYCKSQDPQVEKVPNLSLSPTIGKATVVQVGCITVRKPLSEEMLSDLFNDVIASIRRYLRAYHIVTQYPIEFVTRQNTSSVIPYSTEDIDNKGQPVDNRESLQTGILIVHPPKATTTVEDSIATEQLDQIALTSSTYLDNTLDQFYNIRREAFIAYNKGNSIVASLLMGIAAETLLDELLLMLLWEEGALPKDVFKLFKDEKSDTTLKRVESDLYSKRLGEEWSSLKKGTAIRKWRYKILELRNRVAHIGYEPTEEEMQEGLDALVELVSFTSDSLCQNLKKYPISADLTVGYSGMTKRGCRDEFEELLKDFLRPNNPQRIFGCWKFEVERFRNEKPFKGNYKKSKPAYLIHANGEETWLLLDDENRLVQRIPNQEIGDPSTRNNIDSSIRKAKESRRGQNTLIEIRDGLKPKYKKDNGKDWFPLYAISDSRSISCWPISYPFTV